MGMDFPFEVLCHILSYLEPRQRLCASLVCKQWLQAADTLLEDVQLTIRDKALPPLTDRVFPRIAFISKVIDVACVDFLNRIGPRLLHLRFIKCSVSTSEKVVDCSRLLTLEANYCVYLLLLFVSLPRLKDLNLKGVFNIADDTLMTFEKIAAPNLEVFSAPNPTLLYKRLVFEDYYPEGTNLERNPSPYVLSHAAIEAFVTMRVATLTTLHFPSKVTPNDALRFSKIDGLQLRSVSFEYFDEVSELSEFCRNQPGIVALNLGYSISLRDEHVVEICDLLPELREFSVEGVSDLDRAIIPLLQLRHLRVLCLISCSGVTPASFLAAIPTTPMLELRTLNLSYSKILGEHILALLSQAPRLVELDLTDCDISNKTLVHACNLLTCLRVLVLKENKVLSDEGLRGISKLTRLVRLDLSACLRLTSAGVKESIRFQRLKELGLTHCPRVFRNVIKPLRAHNPCLTLLWWSHLVEKW